MQKTSVVSWLFYNIRVLSSIFLIYNPFRNTLTLPARFTPNVSWIIFIFGLVILLLIYAPLAFFLIILANTGEASFGLFVPSAFGFVFGTFFRFVAGDFLNYILLDRRTLTYVKLGFKKKVIETIDRNNLVGLVMMKRKYRGTKNYKICVQFEDERLLMIFITTSERKAERRMSQYKQLFNLEESPTFDSKNLINDANYSHTR